MNYINEYWNKIQSGEIIVGKWISLLYGIITKGIDAGSYLFSEKKAERAITFIERFVRHNKGPLAPSIIKLELWQKALISIIFGILNPGNKKRMFTSVFMVVGRKQGKTLLCSAIMSYSAYVDGEYGGEIYCVAPKLDQSDLVYSAFKFTVDHEPSFSAITKPRKNDLYIKSTNTSIKKIAFSDKRSDGYNPSVTILDEVSAWPGQRGLKQYEVMASGTGARSQPLTIAISSAGYENGGIYDELFARGTAFLSGNSKESHFLPIMYTIDDLTRWDDLGELHKSLPGLGVSVSESFINSEIETAYQSLSKKAEFLTKYCNVKQNSSCAWLPADIIESACHKSMDLADFSDVYAVCGIDLSQTTDLTAVVTVIEKNGFINVIAHFFLPRAKIEEASARDGLPYEIYIQRGLLTPSGDNFIDYRDVMNYLEKLVTDYKIYPLVTGYDRWSSTYLVNELKQKGFKLDDVFQGDNLYGVIQETGALFRDKKINIGDNDLLKIHLLNSAIKMSEERGRGKLVKLSPKDHIDGCAAFLDAMTVRQKWYSDFGQRLSNT